MFKIKGLILKKFKRKLIAVVKGERIFDRESGEWVEGTPLEIDFEGAILPFSSKDATQLQASVEGMYSVNDKKLYTENNIFLNDTVIKDGDKLYKIYLGRDYDIVDPDFKLYYMKKIDKIDG